MAKQLWASASPDAWTDVAGRLPLMLAQHQPAKLQQLNRWVGGGWVCPCHLTTPASS
jgi:hypothetical protein